MVVISRAVPNVLLGFVISNISNSTIDLAIADFKLGAFDDYNAIVELSLDQTRFVGSTPEQVRDQLDAEDIRKPFVLLDSETTDSRSVWWVGRYLHERNPSIRAADSWHSDWQYNERQQYVLNVPSDERILLKSRLSTVEVPMFITNGLVDSGLVFQVAGFMGSEVESLGYSQDPHRPQKPYIKYDWEQKPPAPPPAYVVATPDEYEISTDTLQKQNFLVGFGPPRDVVRLKEAVAREHGLQSVWTYKTDSAASSLAFYQNWATKK